MLDLLVVVWLMLKWWHLFGRVIARCCIGDRKIHIRPSQCTSANASKENGFASNCHDSDTAVQDVILFQETTKVNCRQRNNIVSCQPYVSTDKLNVNLDNNLNLTKTSVEQHGSQGVRLKEAKPKLQPNVINNGYFISDKLCDVKQTRQTKSSHITGNCSRSRKTKSKSKSPPEDSRDLKRWVYDSDHSVKELGNKHSEILGQAYNGVQETVSVLSKKAICSDCHATELRVRTLKNDTLCKSDERDKSVCLVSSQCKTDADRLNNLQKETLTLNLNPVDNTDGFSYLGCSDTREKLVDCSQVTVTNNTFRGTCQITEKSSTKVLSQSEFVAQSDGRPVDLPDLTKQADINETVDSIEDDDKTPTNCEVGDNTKSENTSEAHMAYRRSLSVDSSQTRNFVPSVDRITVYERYMADQNQELISQMSHRRRSYEHLGRRESSPDDRQNIDRLPPGKVIVTKTSPKRSRYASCSVEVTERRRNIQLEHETYTDKYTKFGSASRHNLSEGMIRCKIREHMSNIIGKQLYPSDEDVMYTYNLESSSYSDFARDSDRETQNARDRSFTTDTDISSNGKVEDEQSGYSADAELDSSGNHSVGEVNETLTSSLGALNTVPEFDATLVQEARTDVANQDESKIKHFVTEGVVVLPFEENFDVLALSSENSSNIPVEITSASEDVTEATEDIDESFDLSELALGSYDFSLLKSDGTEISDDFGGSTQASEQEDQKTSEVSNLYVILDTCICIGALVFLCTAVCYPSGWLLIDWSICCLWQCS